MTATSTTSLAALKTSWRACPAGQSACLAMRMIFAAVGIRVGKRVLDPWLRGGLDTAYSAEIIGRQGGRRLQLRTRTAHREEDKQP